VIASQSKSEPTESDRMTRPFSKVSSEVPSIGSRCLLRDGLSSHTTQGLNSPFLVGDRFAEQVQFCSSSCLFRARTTCGRLCAFSLELLLGAEIRPKSMMDMGLRHRAIFYVKNWPVMVDQRR
jgi:hypothetical protein